MLLTGNGAFPPNFFCNKVADVIDAKAINDAMIPKEGKLSPKSKPRTIAAPVNPVSYTHLTLPTICSV